MMSHSEQRLNDVVELLSGGDFTIALDLRARLMAARVDPEDPLAVLLATSLREQIRMRELEDMGARHIEQLTKGFDGLPQRLAGQLTSAVETAIKAEVRHSLPNVLRSLRIHSLALALSGVLGFAALASIAGYISGRQQTAEVAQSWSKVATSAHGAAWVDLEATNPHLPAWIDAACQPGGVGRFMVEGKAACTVTLWADPPSPGGRWSWLAYLTQSPAFDAFLLFFGICLGGAIAFWARRGQVD